MSHDENLRQRADVTLETVVRRILRTFDRATASDVESGARWYADAGDLATSLAVYVDGDRDKAAAVISALSPRTSWARNVATATAMLQSGPSAARKLGAMRGNVDVAIRAKRNGTSALNGPKTRRFAANILGDREAVTIDVWAARVAGVTELQLGRVGVYDDLEHAYRLAAGRRGVDPATMQAVTWVVARNGRAG